jgi:hypothetical protein
MSQQILDAQDAYAFAIKQASIIEPTVYATRYPDIQYRDLVPVDTTGSEFATSVTYFSSDHYGKAGWVNGNSDDIPKAGSTRAKHETAVHTAGIGYGWGWEELGRAQMLGVNLPAEDAMAARRAAEEMVDRVTLSGDAEKNFEGLFNNSAVTAAAATNGDWSSLSTTGPQIAQDINNAILNIFNGTNTVSIADRLLLPYSKFHVISTRQFSSASDLTILEWIRRNNVYTAQTGQPLMIRGLRGLDTAGVSGTARMISYRYDPNVLKLHMPMPHRFLPVWQAGPTRWDVPGLMRLGGLDIRLPKEVVYVDGI